jgi:hypothetical protein
MVEDAAEKRVRGEAVNRMNSKRKTSLVVGIGREDNWVGNFP